jgi:hypothetical protein
MIPKIIHNIWIQGYENLPNDNKVTYANIKKNNPEWEFMIWDDEMIKKLLKKYPSIYNMYVKTNNYTETRGNTIKSDIARYMIMKEYGGLYFDMDFKCTSSFNELFLNDHTENNENNDINEMNKKKETKKTTKNTIYIASSNTNIWNYINPFQKTKYYSCFMAMDKNHPIWESVIQKLKHATNKFQIREALDISLQESENENDNIKHFPIILLNKVNGNYYQCVNDDTICYTQSSSSSWYLITPILKYINCYYKQIILFFLAVLIIIAVEYLYMHNAKSYGAVSFIPGMPGSAAPPSNPILQKRKGKRNTRV